jgi:fucose permease
MPKNHSWGPGGGRSLFVLLLAGFAAYGAMLTTFGATVPRIVTDFSWSYATTGLVLAVMSVGFFLSTFASGLLLEGSSPKWIYIAAMVLSAAGIALFGQWSSVAVNLLLCFGIGISQGVIEVVTNYETVRMETAGRSRFMNLLHAGFSAGAILGPLAVGTILQAGLSWRIVFQAGGGIFLVLAALCAFWDFPVPERGVHQGASGGIALLGKPVVILLSLAMVFYVGSELGATNWVAEYFVRVLGSSPSTGAFSVSALWIGMLAGRSLLSLVGRAEKKALTVIILSTVCVACLLAFMALRSILPAMALVFALGLGYSGIYPLIMTIAGQAFRSTAAVGMLSTAAGLGSFTFPFLLAGISQTTGLRRGFVLLAVLPLGITLTVALASRYMRRGSPPP